MGVLLQCYRYIRNPVFASAGYVDDDDVLIVRLQKELYAPSIHTGPACSWDYIYMAVKLIVAMNTSCPGFEFSICATPRSSVERDILKFTKADDSTGPIGIISVIPSMLDDLTTPLHHVQFQITYDPAAFTDNCDPTSNQINHIGKQFATYAGRANFIVRESFGCVSPNRHRSHLYALLPCPKLPSLSLAQDQYQKYKQYNLPIVYKNDNVSTLIYSRRGSPRPSFLEPLHTDDVFVKVDIFYWASIRYTVTGIVTKS